MGATDGNNRVICYDRLNFNDDGTIQPVKMLVQDNFDDNNMFGWNTFGGSFVASGQSLQASQAEGAKALLDTDFGDLTVSVEITHNTPSESDADAGLIFRASNPKEGVDSFRGYYAGIKLTGEVVLWKMNDTTALQLGRNNLNVSAGTSYRLQVIASGEDIKVFVDDLDTALISVKDGTHVSGMDGVRVFKTAATFDNFKLQAEA